MSKEIHSFPKPTTFRSEGYLRHVRTYPCLVCGKPGPNQAHHLSLGDAGWGMKSSDLGAVPLCAEHHRLYHDDPAKFRSMIDAAASWEAMYWMIRTWIEREFGV
jgi:hypothetical protein